jgi:hypothetical protein
MANNPERGQGSSWTLVPTGGGREDKKGEQEKKKEKGKETKEEKQRQEKNEEEEKDDNLIKVQEVMFHKLMIEITILPCNNWRILYTNVTVKVQEMIGSNY